MSAHGHQVEVHGLGAARVGAVAHAQQHDVAEGDCAHGHQGGEGDAAHHEALGQLGLVDARQPAFAHHRQRQADADLGRIDLLVPGLERRLDAPEQGLFGTGAGGQGALQHGSQNMVPLAGGLGFDQALTNLVEGHDQPVQRSHQGGVEAGDFVVGHDVAPVLAVVAGLAHGVAHQHALQAEAPGVQLVVFRQAEFGSLGGIEAPAYVGLANPALQGGKVPLAKAKARADGRDVQQVEDLAGAKTQTRQRQQGLQCHQHGFAMAFLLVGHVVGQVALLARGELAEYRVDIGRVVVDVRHHHHHVPGFESRILGEGLEQLVVQNLQFTLRAVADVKTDRVVLLGIKRWPLGLGLRQRAQVEDVVLQLAQQGVGGRRQEQIHRVVEQGAQRLHVGVVMFAE